jgi:regulator of replication initiation timing
MKKSIFSIIFFALLGNFAIAQNDLSYSTLMSLRQNNLSDFEAAKSLPATFHYTLKEYSELGSAAQKVINIDNDLIKLAKEAEDCRKENQRLQSENQRLRADVERQTSVETASIPVKNRRNATTVEEEDTSDVAGTFGWLSKNIAWVLLAGFGAFYIWKKNN